MEEEEEEEMEEVEHKTKCSIPSYMTPPQKQHRNTNKNTIKNNNNNDDNIKDFYCRPSCSSPSFVKCILLCTDSQQQKKPHNQPHTHPADRFWGVTLSSFCSIRRYLRAGLLFTCSE